MEKAEDNLEVLLDSEDERVKGDMTKFVAKTLGKDEGYSERTEHTGKDGKDLIPKPILNVQPNDGHIQDNKPQEENPSPPGGDISVEDNISPPLPDSMGPVGQ